MALSTCPHVPRFRRWVTVLCSLVCLSLAGVLATYEVFEEQDELVHRYLVTMLEFQEGYGDAPQWQRWMTGYSSSAEISNEIERYTGWTVEEAMEVSTLEEDSPAFERVLTAGGVSIGVVVLALIGMLVFARGRERPMPNKYTSYMGFWSFGKLCAASVRVVAIYVGLVVVGYLAFELLGGDSEGALALLFVECSVRLGVVFLLVLWCYRRWSIFARSARLDSGYLGTRSCWFYVSVGLILTAFLDLVVELGGRLGLSLSVTDFLDPMLIDGGLGMLVAQLALAVVVAPITEEVCFRGFLYPTLRRGMGAWGAAFVSSGLFAVIHFYSVLGMLSVFLAGLLFAFLYQRSGSLWPSILVHAIGNLLAVLVVWYVFYT